MTQQSKVSLNMHEYLSCISDNNYDPFKMRIFFLNLCHACRFFKPLEDSTLTVIAGKYVEFYFDICNLFHSKVD